MNAKWLVLMVSFFLFISLLAPKTTKAFDLQETLTSENSIVVKIQEGVEYFFAFKIENKVQVLERHAEKRLTMAQGYAEEGNNERVQNLLQSYLQIKERQNELLGEIKDGEVLGMVEERTIEQQKTMEEIKTRIDKDGKEGVVQVQERVVNQVAERVIEFNGTEGQTEFFQKVEHVWAPGTGPGGEAGVVIEGGTMQFAPGTSAGRPSGSDIKTVEVKTGGGSDNGSGTTVQGGGSQNVVDPGTSSGANTIDPGGVNTDPGTPTEGSKTWIAP